jgi:hypothetical protein
MVTRFLYPNAPKSWYKGLSGKVSSGRNSERHYKCDFLPVTSIDLPEEGTASLEGGRADARFKEAELDD